MKNTTRNSIIIVQVLMVFILALLILGRNSGVPYYLFWPVIFMISTITILGYNFPVSHKIMLIVFLRLRLP